MGFLVSAPFWSDPPRVLLHELVPAARPKCIHAFRNKWGLVNAGAAALVAALCDADTPVWLDDRLRGNEDIAGWIGFHAGAPVAAEPGAAQFAIIADPQTMPALERFAPGSQEYPDRSATIILQIDTLQEGSPLVLTGPGIETTASIAPAPMPPMFVQQWQANRALSPRGIDVVLATADAVAGLPRSVMIEEG